MNIGERIKQRRIELGMSQDDLARKLGYAHKTSISKIENGSQNLTQTKIASIASALETTPAYIMGWEDEEEPAPQLDDLEQKILEAYRSLPDSKKLALYEFIIQMKE